MKPKITIFFQNTSHIIFFLIFSLFLFFIYISYKRYKRQIMQYKILAGISNEYIYEYNVKKDLLILSSEISSLLKVPERIKNFKKSSFSHHQKLLKMLSTDPIINEITFSEKEHRPEVFKVVCSPIPGKDQKTKSIIGKLVNISEEKERLRTLCIQAQIDGLTGLYNSDTTRRLIRQACLEFSDITMSGVLFSIDIDNFKSINDSYGHPVGDKVLTEIAGSLKKVFCDIAIVGRIGGDEFCVFMKGMVTKDMVKDKCEQLLHIHTASGCHGQISTTLSIGVALIQDRPIIFEELYQRADKALYQAKRNGRNGYYIEMI